MFINRYIVYISRLFSNIPVEFWGSDHLPKFLKYEQEFRILNVKMISVQYPYKKKCVTTLKLFFGYSPAIQKVVPRIPIQHNNRHYGGEVVFNIFISLKS